MVSPHDDFGIHRTRMASLELQVVVVFGGYQMYRYGVVPENIEHSERRDRDGAAAGMSLSMRPRMAAARQDGETARLSKMQESEMGRAKGRPQICPFDASPIEIGPREIDECVIHSL
jgi:hypothetical protein